MQVSGVNPITSTCVAFITQPVGQIRRFVPDVIFPTSPYYVESSGLDSHAPGLTPTMVFVGAYTWVGSCIYT